MNYLYEFTESGERIFVQADTIEEAEEILAYYEFDEEEIEFLGEFEDWEAEMLGYDTY